ncbi:ureidoacrylate peracid hydrolase [Methylacidimicrobium cyclopophantes]|uniref:Ureidoacrylate peracid hydrolase n=1 Tax=Methylacidimicrobium cyclopophantes TaxID=1041766 RepID=A0A5E6M9Y7_9BACT|nr:isochorismatase family cysteine hydrolase [Methylacidimicrobium cyclopophantes]VVM05779.1 ureidoacrylate peracid hydrolase [Methylacidimicrobium cyclopophantes]
MESVIVVDMVVDFLRGKLATGRETAVIEPLLSLLSAARRSRRSVIYVSDAHLPHDPELRVWGEHAMKGSEGARIVAELAPQNGDYVLEKRTYSAFFETGLDSLLRSLGVDTVILTGLHTHLCIRHSAAGAFFRGYRILVPVDCVGAFTEQEQTSGLEYLRRNYGAEMTTSSNLAQRLSFESSRPADGE